MITINDIEIKDKRVSKYITSLLEVVKDDKGDIDNGYLLSLQLIADNYQMYLVSKDAIEKYGLIMQGQYGLTKNPASTTMGQAQSALLQLIKSFGLSPEAQSKIKVFKEDKKTTAAANAAALIAALTE